MMKTYLLVLTCTVLFLSFSANAQLLNGNAFIKGQYLELGIAPFGVFGAWLDAPPGYHARSAINNTAGFPPPNDRPGNLGFVADVGKNGWDVKGAADKNKFNGDYFLPQWPICGWGSGYGGGVQAFDRLFPGGVNNSSTSPTFPNGTPPPANFGNVSVSRIGDRSVAVWQGNVNFLRIRKEVSIQDTSLFCKVKLTITNIGPNITPNVYFTEYLNPDNGYFLNDVPTGDLNTKNSIIYQNPANGKALIEARSSPATNVYMGIGTRDCRARVARIQNSGRLICNLPGSYNGTAGILISGTDPDFSNDYTVAITLLHPSLAPGVSTTFIYTYIFREQDAKRALDATAPGFAVNNIEHNSNDTIYVCPNSTVPVKMTNGENYSWSWPAASGIFPTSGPNVNINVGSGPAQYIATGTGPCGTFKDTINFIPYGSNRLYVDSAVTISGTGTSWASPFKTVSEALDVVNNYSCMNEVWVKKGTYFPMQNPTEEATSRDSSFRVMRSGTKLYGGFAGTETSIGQRVIAANPTILSGNLNSRSTASDNAYHVMTLINTAGTNDTSTVDGFDITGGLADGTTAPVFNGTTINSSRGAGIFASRHILKMENNSFYDNKASREGGGLYVSHIASQQVNNMYTLISKCKFAANRAFWGGGVFIGQSLVIIRKSEFENNIAVTGAGIYLNNNSGGAITSAIVENTIIRGNECIADPADATIPLGAGIAVNRDCNLSTINCQITGNKAQSAPALFFHQSTNSLPSILTVINSTVSGNYSYTPNYGVILIQNANSIFQNDIIYGNNETINNLNSTAPQLFNSLIQGFSPTANGNINGNVDPRFTNPVAFGSAPTVAGTYTLNDCSPVKDKGNNSFVPANITTDLSGGARIQHAIVDMGAFESARALATVSISVSPVMPACTGTIYNFTATALNEGPVASGYQWLLNGVAMAGETNSTFTAPVLAAGDQVSVTMTANYPGCSAAPVTSNTIAASYATLQTPTVSIIASDNNVCAGTPITFTASAANGGPAPVYQWSVNGINAGTNSATFTNSTLANNDVVKVTMLSNSNCVTTPNAISNDIIIKVNPLINATVAITASQNNICAGTSVSFSATPVNGGTAPSYQWQVNGANAGTNSATFTSTTLNNNDAVTVTLTSNATCVSPANVISNSISMVVTTPVTPAVIITGNKNNICSGTLVTFTAAAVNAGASPTYQWQVNGVNAGTNSATFSSSTLTNNEVVTVKLISSVACVTATTVVSNGITMIVVPAVTASAVITASANNICAGVPVTFTSNISNGGNNPMYQWRINGANAGTNSSSFSSAVLQQNDVITLQVTSNATCVTNPIVLSNVVNMRVNPNLTPAITISSNKSEYCENENIILQAVISNGGNNPTYQWKLNGINAGTNSNQFSSTNFQNNDAIVAILTSSETCLATNFIESNNIILKISPNPVLSLIADNPEILAGGSTTLTVTSAVPLFTWNWQPANSLNNAQIASPTASPTANTIYTLQAASAAGCKASGSVLVKVVPGPRISNTFSPNGDGINETWLIKNLETYPECRVKVFTRTGQAVFESKGYKQPWDGKFRGQSLPTDTYYYVIELNNRIGSQPITGYVTIVK